MRAHQVGEMTVGSLNWEDLARLLKTDEAMEGLVVVKVVCQWRSIQCGVGYPPLCGCATVSTVIRDLELETVVKNS